MKCEECRELLWAYLKNETSAQENAEIEEHLRHCTECREEEKELAELIGSLTTLPEEELPEGFHAELMDKIKAEDKKVIPFPVQKKKQAGKWKQLSLAAAAVLVVVAVGGMNGLLEMRQGQEQVMQEAAAEHNDALPKTEQAENMQREASAEKAMPEENDREAAQEKGTAAKPEAERKQTPVIQKDSAAKENRHVPAERKAAEKQEDDLGLMMLSNEDAEIGTPRMFHHGEAAEASSVLIAENAAEAKQAVRESIAALGGTEKTADEADVILAVIPEAHLDAFYESLDSLGQYEVTQDAFASDEDGLCTVKVEVRGK